jgi:acetylglutamate kinase
LHPGLLLVTLPSVPAYPLSYEHLIAKTNVLLEALPYIQSFRGSIFVLKYGGSFMDDPDPAVRSRVAQDVAFLAAVGINAVVVHGGGKAISTAMQKAGLQPNFVKGLRVTDEATIQVVKRVLDVEVNSEVCDMIRKYRGNPKSLPGETCLECVKLDKDDDGEPIDLGYVGEVSEVKAKVIKKAISDGYTPVISSVGEGLDGKPYNVNADSAASRIAIALRARRLIFMSDVPGLMMDPKDPSSLISTLKIDEVEDLKKRGIIDKGMRPKIQAAVRALREGVHRVHLIDGRIPHSVLLEIFTDKGIGTELVHAVR